MKTYRPCGFCTQCPSCLCQSSCIGSTRITYQKRRFVLALCNTPVFTKETRARFKAGNEAHDEIQEGIQTIDEMGYIEYRRRLYEKELITLKELKICSPLFSLHGIIDMVKIRYDGKNVDIWLDEIKPYYKNSHFIQMMVYGIILSDKNCNLIYEVKARAKTKIVNGAARRVIKIKKMLGKLLPKDIEYINIKGRVLSYNSEKESNYVDIVEKNRFTDTADGIKAFIAKTEKEYKKIMINREIDMEQVRYCKGCDKEHKSDYCGWRELCNRFGYNAKSKQYYFGKKITRPIIKTKPRIVY